MDGRIGYRDQVVANNEEAHSCTMPMNMRVV